MQSLVPKNRKPKFDLNFKILDLNNIPYVSGKVSIKWHLPSSSEHGDRTPKTSIKDHKVIFDYEKTVSVRLVVDKNGILQESNLILEIIHEVPSGGKEERTLLGLVKINISEYVEATRQTSDPVQRRHLLHDSKINSTLKVAIHLNQTEGDRTFLAPQLRSAPVFVGIAGVMAGEEEDNGDTTQTPVMNQQNREAGDELRDLYRKTLAADVMGQAGVPSADQVVEDIFAGGDGWCGTQPYDSTTPTSTNGQKHPNSLMGGSGADDNGHWSDDGASGSLHVNKRSWPDFQFSKRGRGSRENLTSSRSRSSFGHGSHSDMDKEHGGATPEVNELDIREDLRCWNYSE